MAVQVMYIYNLKFHFVSLKFHILLTVCVFSKTKYEPVCFVNVMKMFDLFKKYMRNFQYFNACIMQPYCM